MKRKIILRKAYQVERFVDAVQEAVVEHENGGDLHEVLIRPYKSKRSLEANAKLHALLASIASFTGDDMESTKLQMKSLFLIPKATHKLPSGDKYVVFPSTADFNVSEMSEFIEKVQAFAISELGFVDNSL